MQTVTIWQQSCVVSLICNFHRCFPFSPKREDSKAKYIYFMMNNSNTDGIKFKRNIFFIVALKV